MDALSTRCIAEESANARNAYFAQRVLTLHGELSAAEAGHILIADLLLKWIRYRHHHVKLWTGRTIMLSSYALLKFFPLY